MKNNKKKEFTQIQSVKTDFDIATYIGVVNSIANAYFNDDGEYVPYFGKLNAMRLFYNECVVESKFDLPHDIVDAVEMESLVADEDFIEAFNAALSSDGLMRYDFANAYGDAMSIVQSRLSSIGNAVDRIKKALEELIDRINPITDNNNIDKLSQISEAISKGKLNPDNIVAAFNKLNTK